MQVTMRIDKYVRLLTTSATIVAAIIYLYFQIIARESPELDINRQSDSLRVVFAREKARLYEASDNLQRAQERFNSMLVQIDTALKPRTGQELAYLTRLQHIDATNKAVQSDLSARIDNLKTVIDQNKASIEALRQAINPLTGC